MVRQKANFAGSSAAPPPPSSNVNGNFLAEMGDTKQGDFRTFMHAFRRAQPSSTAAAKSRLLDDDDEEQHRKNPATIAEGSRASLESLDAFGESSQAAPELRKRSSADEYEMAQVNLNASWGGRLSSCRDHDKPVIDPKAPYRIAQWRIQLLKTFGVNIGSNGHTVLSYNPRIVQSGGNIMVVLLLLPRIFTRMLAGQWVALCIIAELYAYKFSDGDGPKDAVVQEFSRNVMGLTRFVLGMFVSLVLAKTYYANRGEFGVVFGRTMGFAQMVTAWIRMPLDAHCPMHARRVQLDARHLLVRWANAAFRLMVLEARDLTPDQIGDSLIQRELLSHAEWGHVAGLKSRATHVYQWMNNVISDLQDAGYIRDPVYVTRLNTHIDDMRGANVWGLPSLPIMYTILITVMVKLALTLLALTQGSRLKNVANVTNGGHLIGEHDEVHGGIMRTHIEVIISVGLGNLVFQGLLDIHQVLFHPNQGTEVSHMPSDNFLDFVETVTTDLIAKNEALPYATGTGAVTQGDRRVDTPTWAGLLAREVDDIDKAV